jgi:peptide/nickel transport system substrate-binding protein
MRSRPAPGGRAAVPILALAALAILAGCAPVADPASTLTVAIDSGPPSLDPRLGSDEAARRLNDLVFSGLFRVDETAHPVPDLARSWEQPDPRTVVVRLRGDVRFHDGSRLTARDVLYTYRSILENEVPSFRREDLGSVSAIEAPDEQTVVFRLRGPFAPILTNLNVPILRAGSGPSAAARPVGTGPYRLVRYRKDEDLTLRRFDGYFAGHRGPENIRLRIIPTETARLLELLKGGVDLIVNDLSPDQIARVRREPGYRVETLPGRNYVYMGFNLLDPILADRRVREAIARALDREAIVRHLLHGAATLATGLLPPGHWAYEPDVPRFGPDPEGAARLLDQAGHPDPDGAGPGARFRLTYKTTSSEVALQQAAIVQQQLARVGIVVDIRAYEWATFYEDLKAGRFQIVVSNWTEIADPDIYRLRFHSRYRPPAGFNRGSYSNPEVDRLIERGAATLDETVRRTIYAGIQRLLARDLPYVSLWHRDVTAIRRERVRGFRLTPGADFYPLREVTLAAPGAPGSTGVPVSGQLAPQDPLHGGDRHRPGADQARRVGREIDDRGGGAAAGRASIEYEGDRVGQRLLHLGRGGWGRLAGAVGAGGHDRTARRPRQGRSDRVRRDAHADRVPATQEPRRQIGGSGQDQGQGSGPEGGGQAAGHVRHLAHAQEHRRLVGGDERQGHPIGAALGLEHPVDGLRAARIGAQAVEGLGRVGDEMAAAQTLSGARDRDGVRMIGVDALHPLHGVPRAGSVRSTIPQSGPARARRATPLPSRGVA